MTYVILSDIHSNLEALTRAVEELSTVDADVCLFLGDAVGYGADPDDVVTLLRRLLTRYKTSYAVRGNHDKVASGIEDGFNFQDHARKVALWTRDHLSPTNLNYIRRLSRGPIEANHWIQICHGSPVDEDLYILRNVRAFHMLAYDFHHITFFGHTHLPAIYEYKDGKLRVLFPSEDEFSYRLDPGARYMINPGSVGQPRDLNPKLSFAIYDDESELVTIKRFEYDIESAANKIIANDLPDGNARRLYFGR